MTTLVVTQALPNPRGKDRNRHGATNDQLNGEWVEFWNATRAAVQLDGVSLVHQTFNHHCHRTGSDPLMNFTGTLDAGKYLRVHTGRGTGFWDAEVFHLFLNRGSYVWNNDCGDSVLLQKGGTVVDWAGYGPRPSEGAVLKRVSGKNWLA